MSRIMWILFTALLTTSGSGVAADWIHWRGPEQNGVAREKGLPEYFDPNQTGKDGVLWKVPYGGRSAPLVMKGRVYTISGYDMGQLTEGERVMCFDADTGKVHWENRFNVFHTDIVSSRLGWTTLTADPEKEFVYCHTTGGFLFCFNKYGQIVWQHQLTEEYGRVTGYGGRIVSPIFDEGLVILGMVNGSWGDQARGNGRFVAFDGATGEVVWWSSPTEDFVAQTGAKNVALRGTYYSNPIIAVVNGQRLLIAGGADGCIHALKVRTGERVWSYHISAGVVNPSPVIDGNLVYICHGEENPEGGPIGRIVCLDASQITKKKPKVVWEQKRLGKRFGLASPAISDGLLYIPEDSSKLFCFDAKTGRRLWEVTYGTVSRGAPLVADGKLYIFDVNAKLAIFKLQGKDEPEELFPISFRRESGVGFVETHGTPIAVNNRLYFLTQDHLYCVAGNPSAGEKPQYQPIQAESEYSKQAEIASVRIYPSDVLAKSGEELKFKAIFLDSNGREITPSSSPMLSWTLPQPPLPPTAPKGASPPPALNAQLSSDADNATLKLGALPAQHGVVRLTVNGKLVANARVRVAGLPPYQIDFDKTPVGAVPSGWVNAQAKFTIVEKDGNRVLSKINTDSRPPIARANAYITPPNVSNYTIEADVMGTEVANRLPDIGLVNSRYTLLLDGKSDSPNGKRQLRIVSWEARPRVNEAAEFHWEPEVWYRVKLSVKTVDNKAIVQAKVWKKGEQEPAKWLVTFEDPSPNREGAAALYGYVSNVTEKPGSAIFYDNVTIVPNESTNK